MEGNGFISRVWHEHLGLQGVDTESHNSIGEIDMKWTSNACTFPRDKEQLVKGELK